MTIEGKPALASITVLVVDEQNLFRDGIENLLTAQPDMTVVGCSDTTAGAVEQIRKSHPDICLLGWPASSPSSQKIFHAIQDSKVATRVIILANEDLKEDFFEAVRQGCSGIVPKQTSTELLLKSIRKVQAGELWLDRKTTADVIRRLSKKGASPAAAGWRAAGDSRTGRGVEHPGAGNRGPRCAGFQEQGNGRADVYQRADGEKSSAQYFR